MDQQTKNKIAQCLVLSMEIEGATFMHSSNNQTVNVYKIENGVQVWSHKAFHNLGSLDELMNDLSKYITYETLSH